MLITEKFSKFYTNRAQALVKLVCEIDDTIKLPDEFLKTDNGTFKEFQRGGHTVKIPAAQVPEVQYREIEVVLPTNLDMPGFHVVGTTRQGKSVFIKQVLNGIRAAGMRAVINDPKGEFLERYWTPSSKIMNIFDVRAEKWSPLAEIKDVPDYEAVAYSFFPDDPNQKQPIFILGPRAIFKEILKISKSNTDILRFSRMPHDQISALLSGTSADKFVNSSPNLVGAILANLQTRLLFLEYMEEPADGKYFSVRDWVRNGEDGSWLFLSFLEKHMAIMRPYISAILDQVAMESISMPPSRLARFWVVIDEIGRLQPLKALEGMTRQGAGHGVRWIFAHQSYAQLEAIYGKEMASDLSANCANKVIFACGDTDGAGEWCSAMMGMEIVREKRKTFSSKVDDGESWTYTSVRLPERPVIPASNFKALTPLHCYVSFLGTKYTTMMHICFDNGPKATEAFIFRDLSIEQKLDEVSKAISTVIPEPSAETQYMPVHVDLGAIAPQLQDFAESFCPPIPSVGDIDLLGEFE